MKQRPALKKTLSRQEVVKRLRFHPDQAEQDDSAYSTDKEVAMKTKKRNTIPTAKTAILALAEIKAATRAFDRGEINVIDALDAIVVAVGAYQAAEQRRRDAA